MASRRGRLDPDTGLGVSLNGTATRLARADQVDLNAAVDELRTLAAGRRDLLGQQAGSILGGYLARPATSHPAQVLAAALLVLAGADPSAIPEAFDATRRSATSAQPGTGRW